MSSRFRPSAYPAHWPTLRQAVLARAAYTCECWGECGSVHPQGRCTVPHLAWVVRDPDDPARWHVVVSPASGTIRIVLAVAHLCQDSACANLTCLRGLCQRCHRFCREFYSGLISGMLSLGNPDWMREGEHK